LKLIVSCLLFLTSQFIFAGEINSTADNVQIAIHFDEGTASTAYNFGAKKQTLGFNFFNGATFTRGKFGNGLSFDGVNDYVEVVTKESLLDLPNNGATLGFWIKPYEDTRGNQIDICGTGAQAAEYILYKAPGGSGVRLFNNGSGDQATGIQLDFNKWQSIVMLNRATRIEIYKNGELQFISNSGFDGGAAADKFRFGAATPTNTFIVDYDELVVWDKLLTLAEIKGFHNAGFPVTISD